MADEIELTPTSHMVLGLLSMSGQATPYDLKQMAALTVGEFWTLPHSQLYAEPARLARAGYLTEQQEPHGRRRQLYNLTDRGPAALTSWLQTFAPVATRLALELGIRHERETVACWAEQADEPSR